MSRKRNKDKSPFLLKVVRWLYPILERYWFTLAVRFFTLVFFVPLNYRATEKEKKSASFAQRFRIKAAGKKIQFYRWGEWENYVLVIHGWAGRATQFRRFIKPLNKAGYAVIGFDGPAHGKSQGRSTNIREFEEVLKKIYEVQGVPEAIIAHSFGGAAVLFAVKNGLPVKKVINIASPVIGDKIIDTYLRAIGGTEKTKLFFKQYIFTKYGQPFDAFTVAGFIHQVNQQIELLLVHDEDDSDVSMEHPLELIRLYPSARLLKTKGLGHTRILKDSRVIEEIVTFIRQGTSGKAQ